MNNKIVVDEFFKFVATQDHPLAKIICELSKLPLDEQVDIIIKWHRENPELQKQISAYTKQVEEEVRKQKRGVE